MNSELRTGKWVLLSAAAVLAIGLGVAPAGAKVRPGAYDSGNTSPHPKTGRVDFSTREGFVRSGARHYKTGRVAPEGRLTPIFEHSGRRVVHGRTG